MDWPPKLDENKPLYLSPDQTDRKGSVRASQALLPVPQTGFPYNSR
jgi:hypothetical protein